MTDLHGFELIREQHIAELNTHARLFRHKRTGAELLSLEASDENKTFGVAFATPPTDETGLPHILEHSVLAGSRKYPVKEPFVELLKGSMKTFVNAMTFDDFTLYPVASQNLKDFYNLTDVYLDAVFYPRLMQQTFQQEGWHHEAEDAETPLTYKGVVFNEMKGYYASPDYLLGKYTKSALLPDTPYAFDGGGDPAAIPTLTYDAFKQFHATYYHPSNARFFFYGDDDPTERLRLIDAFIAEFEAQQVDGSVPLQPRFAAPQTTRKSYPVGEGDDSAIVTVSWLLGETADVDTGLALRVLDHILIGTPASPLRKTLIESGLGEDVTGGGLSTFQREMTYSVGLKGVQPDDVPQVEALILETLATLADGGIERDTIEAALNTIEFDLRENNTGWAPRGLVMALYALPTWLHGGDPLKQIAFEASMDYVKARYQNEEHFFEGLIGQYFLDNAHRSTLILEPSDTLQGERDAAETERLARERAALSEADVTHIREEAAALKKMQETPDSPDALATIPRLALSDLDTKVKTIPVEILTLSGAKVLYHDLPTSGIVYLDIALNLHTLPAHLLPYINLYGRALLEMGTENEDFVALFNRIGKSTGGIDTETFTSGVRGSAQGAAWLLLHGKAMAAGHAGDLLGILRDVLLTAQFDDAERFKQMVLEDKAQMEAAVASMGARTMVDKRLRAAFNEADWAEEQMNGVSYLFFLRGLAEKIETEWASVLADLQMIHQTLVNRRAMIVNVTLESGAWGAFQPQLADFIAALPEREMPISDWMREPDGKGEGLTIPAQINYVGKGANLYELGYQLHGSYIVALQYLNTTYLWENIRVKGGAYGGRGAFDPHSGVFGYLSWQDPNLLGTLANYDGAADFLKTLEISEEELTKSIIGAISQLDPHLLPDAKGMRSLVYHLLNYSDEQRQQIWTEVLNTRPEDLRAFGETLAQIAKTGKVVVAASADAINSANTQLDHKLTPVKVL